MKSIEVSIPKVSKKSACYCAVFLVALNLVVYYPALVQDTVNYDDILWIRAGQTPGWDGFLRVMTYDKSVWAGMGYFAPLTAASIMLDCRISGALGSRQVVHKASNLVIHCINTVLVFLLLRLLRFDLWACLTVSAIFAIHPLQVVSVAWLPERKNLIMAAFFFLAITAYCRYRQDGRLRFYLAAVLAYMMALFAKPSAVALGPCLLATDLFLFDRRLTMSSVWRVGPFLVLGLLWTWVATTTEPVVLNAPPLLDRILMIPYKIGFMAAKYFVPQNLTLLYPSIRVDSGSFVWWFQLATSVSLCGLVWFVHRSLGLRGLIWGLCFYVLNLIPSLGLVPFSGMNEYQVADHFQYLSNVGITLAACLILAAMLGLMGETRSRVAKWGLALVVVAMFAPLSIVQLSVWNNAETLWKDVIVKNPGSYTARYNYAHFLDEKSRFKEAVEQYHIALKVNPAAFRSCTNLGILLMNHGKLELASGYFDRAIQINPEFGEPHRNLAKIRFSEKRYQEALEHCRRAKDLGTDCSPDELERVLRLGLQEKGGSAIQE